MNHKRRTTRAQVQMSESIIIVIIVLFLIIFGIVFYYKWAQTNAVFTTADSREEESFATATIASNLPELHCSAENVVDLNCYDTLRITAMKKAIDDSKAPNGPKAAFFFYNSLFKNANVTVYEIYPKAGADVENPTTDPFHVTIYDNPPAKITQKIPARVPVTLYDPITGKSTFGMIEVVRYY